MLEVDWLGGGRLVAKQRHRSHWLQDQLRHGAARRRSYGENTLFARRSAECGDQSRDEAIEIFRSHVDICRVILRPHSHAYGPSCLRSLREIACGRKYNDDTARQKQRNVGSYNKFVDAHSSSPKLTINY